MFSSFSVIATHFMPIQANALAGISRSDQHVLALSAAWTEYSRESKLRRAGRAVTLVIILTAKPEKLCRN
jgi:hypothetical protein